MAGELFDQIRKQQEQHLSTVDGITYYRNERVALGVLNKATDRIHTFALVVFNAKGIYTTVKPVGEKSGAFGRIDPKNVTPTGNIQTGLNATATTLMKYSHHVDGDAHFSDGKDKSLWGTRVHSFPLSEQGRLFEIKANYPEQFHTVTRTKSDRAYALLQATDFGARSIDAIGVWYPMSAYRVWRDMYGGSYEPFAIFEESKTGRQFQAVLVGPDDDNPSHLLMVTMGVHERPETINRKSLMLFGGWQGDTPGFLVCFQPLTYSKPRQQHER